MKFNPHKILFFLTFVFLAPILRAATVSVSFKLEVPSPSGNVVWIEVAVPKSVKQFQAPLNYGGAPTFTKFIDQVTAKDSAGRSLAVVVENNFVKVTPQGSNYVLRYRYQVPQKLSGEVDQSLPVFNSEFARFDNNTLFLLPEGTEEKAADLKIQAPKGWKVATGWGYGEHFSVPTVLKLVSGMIVMGGFEYSQFRVGSINVIFAIKGNYPHKIIKEQFFALLKAQQEIAGPLPSRQLLVAFQPTKNSCCKGTSLTDALIVNMPMDESLEPFNFRAIGTASHELFHQWNVHFIHSEQKDSIYLFSEGFANYFSVATLVRSKLVPIESFAWFLWHYRNLLEANPKYKEADLQKIQSGFQTDDTDLVDLAYVRGPFVAVLLDMALREDTKGKQSLSRWFKVLGQRFGGKTGYNLSLLRSSFVEVSGKPDGQTAKVFDDYFVGGKQFDLNSLFQKLGFSCVTETKKCTLQAIPDERLRDQIFSAE